MQFAWNIRTYGQEPFRVAVVHGGPGAAGDMAEVGRELSRWFGVLEPIQTAATLDGQVGELAVTLQTHGTPPLVVVGHSWGAWLSIIVAARNPDP